MPKEIKLYGRWFTVAGFDYEAQAYWIVLSYHVYPLGCLVPINHAKIEGAK